MKLLGMNDDLIIWNNRYSVEELNARELWDARSPYRASVKLVKKFSQRGKQFNIKFD